MHRGPAAYVLSPPLSRGRDLELEGGVNACHVEYVRIRVARLPRARYRVISGVGTGGAPGAPPIFYASFNNVRVYAIARAHNSN